MKIDYIHNMYTCKEHYSYVSMMLLNFILCSYDHNRNDFRLKISSHSKEFGLGLKLWDDYYYPYIYYNNILQDYGFIKNKIFKLFE